MIPILRMVQQLASGKSKDFRGNFRAWDWSKFFKRLYKDIVAVTFITEV